MYETVGHILPAKLIVFGLGYRRYSLSHRVYTTTIFATPSLTITANTTLRSRIISIRLVVASGCSVENLLLTTSWSQTVVFLDTRGETALYYTSYSGVHVPERKERIDPVTNDSPKRCPQGTRKFDNSQYWGQPTRCRLDIMRVVSSGVSQGAFAKAPLLWLPSLLKEEYGIVIGVQIAPEIGINNA